jgi:hypothetical protein
MARGGFNESKEGQLQGMPSFVGGVNPCLPVKTRQLLLRMKEVFDEFTVTHRGRDRLPRRL